MRKRITGVALGLVTVLAVVLVARAMDVAEPPSPLPIPDALAGLSPDTEGAVENLAAFVRVDTSQPEGVPRSPSPPEALRLLLDRYVEPLGLRYEVLEDRILLIVVPGTDRDLAPVVFLSHYDVVPVAEDERAEWTHPPYEGVVADGFLWGRGALDNKASTICQLEAVRALRALGLSPRREVRILVVPDEEIGGDRGAGAVVSRHLAALGDPELLIDEGSALIPDIIPGITVAAVAVGEKRFVTLRLSVDGEAGHSSMPRPDAAPTLLARALGRLAASRGPVRVLETTEVFLDTISDRMPFARRLALKNRWLFGGAILRQLAAKPATAATIRDTLAITMLEGGVKDNVVPAHVEATVNMRLLPGSSLDDVLARVGAIVDDPRVAIDVVTDWGDTPVQSITDARWERFRSIIITLFPEAVVAPIVTPGTTDARYFAQAGVPTYRFHPFTLDAGERERIHGIDERISISNVEQGIRAYALMMSLL